ncbi:MAG TPA: DUF1778 domain-containing protein [Thermomicrobiales bacterium]|nr:DUF1778 domain-containing protein [Thermomicrobiales bacterium]
MPAANMTKAARLEARITPDQKELIERAAALSGRSMTDFIVSAVESAAAETIRTHQVMRLTLDDTAALLKSLENPPEPSERMLRLAARYREFVGE